MLGWRYRVNNRGFGADTLGQELQYGFALKPPIPPAKDLFGLLECHGVDFALGADGSASSTNCFSWRNPRAIRDFTVPKGTSRIAAICS